MPEDRILVVDDNSAIHEDFRKILRPNSSLNESLMKMEASLFGSTTAKSSAAPSTSYDLQFALQGEEGYRKVSEAAAAGNPFQLVFMDMRMPPGWDGLETIQRIWKDFPNTEVVICSAYSDYSWKEIVDRLGETDRFLFLKKPFEPFEVQQLAVGLTRKWKLARENAAYLSNLEHLVADRTKELEIERVQSANAAKLAALGQLAGGVAHELNTPLSSITLSAGNLLEDLRNPVLDVLACLKSAKTIENTAFRMAKIIRGMLNFSRRSENDDFQRCEVNSVLEDALYLSGPFLKEHEVEVRFTPPPKDLTIQARASEITQILLNLMRNSVDALHGFPEKWISIEIIEAGAFLKIRITDSGNGVSAKARLHIFEPFFTTKEIGKGVGLGLSISREIAVRHGGNLEIDDKCTHTCFVLTLAKKPQGGTNGQNVNRG